MAKRKGPKLVLVEQVFQGVGRNASWRIVYRPSRSKPKYAFPWQVQHLSDNSVFWFCVGEAKTRAQAIDRLRYEQQMDHIRKQETANA